MTVSHGMKPPPLLAALERLLEPCFQADEAFGESECLKLNVTFLLLTLSGLGT